jgi:hypothetical protein
MREEVHGAVLAGCGATMNPQTRDEYRQAIASGVPLTMTDTYVVQRRFDEVGRAQAVERRQTARVSMMV